MNKRYARDNRLVILGSPDFAELVGTSMSAYYIPELKVVLKVRLFAY